MTVKFNFFQIAKAGQVTLAKASFCDMLSFFAQENVNLLKVSSLVAGVETNGFDSLESNGIKYEVSGLP